MRKDALISLLKKYRKKVSADNECYAITSLDNFLTEEKIQLLADHENITVEAFVAYLNEKHQVHLDKFKNEYFTAKFLKSNNPAAAVLYEMFKAELKYKELTSDSEDGQSIDLPREIWTDVIIPMLKPNEAARLSQASSAFYHATAGQLRSPDFWLGKLIELGCDSDMLDEIIKLNFATDFKKLYDNYFDVIKIRDNQLRLRPNSLCAILCLTGETRAILHALELKNVDKNHVDVGSHGEKWSMLDYAIISRNFAAVDFLHTEHGIPFNIISLELAFFTANFSLIERELKTERLKCYRSQIDLLAQGLVSGNISAIEYLLDASKIPKGKRLNGGLCQKIFLFTCESGNVDAIKYALNLFKENKIQISFLILCFGLKNSVLSDKTDAISFIINLAKDYNYTFNDLIQNIRDGFGRNILLIAAKYGKVRSFDFLLPFCGHLNIDDRYTNILSCAGESGNVLMIERALTLCRKLKINPAGAINDRRANLLHIVAESGSLPAIKFVIENSSQLGISLESLDARKNTVFHYAATGENSSAIIYLRKEFQLRNVSIAPSTPNFQGENAWACTNKKCKDSFTKPLGDLEKDITLKR